MHELLSDKDVKGVATSFSITRINLAVYIKYNNSLGATVELGLPEMYSMCITEMIMHQKYTAKSITAPKGGAPGIVFRTAGRAKRIVTAPVTIAGASTFIEYDFQSDS